MTQVVSPSKPITDGQIGKICEVLSARLRKSSMLSDPIQQVIATQGDAIADEMVAALQKRVDAVSEMIARTVKVNRSRAQQEMLDASGRVQYTDKAVVKTMPKGEGEEATVYFFKLGRYVSVGDLAKEYELRGLKPDHYAQAAVNEADPAFADEHPNGTQWQDAQGKFCCLAFGRWGGERRVDCDRSSGDWRDCWWFAGVRK
jgi:hypothetical protein